jgi:anti-sigma regulatory factor (Ser/Thr protein kinase)
MLETDSTRTSTAAARDLLRDHLTANCPWAPAEDVVLAASELLTNARLHAGGWWLLRVEATDSALHLSVLDADPAPPAPRTPDFSGSGGMGWHIIGRLADSIDVTVRPGGKTIRASWHAVREK